jgi:ribosomal protein S18 acetylase RimI-like enzyme
VAFVLEFQPYPGPGGPLTYAAVPWDADLYGIDIYELRSVGALADAEPAIAAWQQEIRKRGQRALVFTRIAPSDVDLAEALSRSGFYPAETTLSISMPLKRLARLGAGPAARATLRPAEAADLPVLLAIAEDAFTTDRFHLDPHLPSDLSDRRFIQWVERGFHDGDHLFVYETTATADAPADVMGFYLVRGEVGGEVDLSLAGVGAKYRRGGVGALMYEAVLQRCAEMGFRIATSTVTTNNPDVVNLFMRLGFVIRSSRLTMHHFVDPTVGL